jgi:hypothetical protein
MAPRNTLRSVSESKVNCRRGLPRFLLAAALVLVPLVLARLGQAQIVNASLYGSVTDPSGAAIPDATVTATNVATGVGTKTISDAAGNYLLPSLPPATYNLAVERAGFRTTLISGIKLLVDQKARVDVPLQVGTVATSVEVSGAAPIVETKTASVGTVIGEQEVLDLPLNLRRLTSLAELVPGTVDDRGLGYAITPAGGSPFGTDVTYTAGGARDSSNTLLLDGMESRAWSTGGFAQLPPPDAVQEFKIQTNIYAAAFGKTAGSTMNLVTKSGTNHFHGDAYEYLRNNDLDARNFFATNQTNPDTGAEIPDSARPEYRRNQFGATFGGPIRQNKTFFFGYYDALREIKGLSLTNLVPTDSQKAGDFSDALTGQTMNLCGAGGPSDLNFDTGQLFDPGTESLFTCPSGSASAGSTILAGNPVPGNVITNIDPVAQKVFAAEPEPNRPGFPNYVNQTPRVRDDNQFGVRIDHNIGPRDQFFAHYLFSQSHITDPSAGYTSLPDFGAKIFYRGQNITAAWVHTFGPHLLNEVHLGFARNNPTLDCIECPRAPGFVESFGIKNLKVQGTSLEEGFPYFAFVNFAGVGDEGYVPISNVEMVEKLEDNVTWTRGRHTIMFGADLQDWQDLRQSNPYSPHGQFTFNGQYSGLAGVIPNVGGISDLADLELGYPAIAGATRTYTDVNQVGGTFDSFYAQDDMKVASNLNLNLGMRWEFRRPPVDKSNNIVQFIPLRPAFSGPGDGLLVTALPDAANDALCTNPIDSYLISASGECLVASSALRQQLGFTGRTRRTIMRPYYRDFAPRFGLTWRPLSSDKFIVRTGYGIFYDLGNLNILQFVSGNPVFSQKPYYSTAFGSPPPLTAGLPTTTENVFASPNVPPLSQQYSALWVPPNFQSPRVQMWSFGIQSQFAQNWALEANYIGTKANHLDNVHDFFNQPEPGVGDLQPRRPYPDFDIMAFFSSDDNSFYNALQMKLTKRFSNSFSFLTSYTFAKSLDDGGGNENYAELPQDDNNRRVNWGRSTFDARQRLALSYIWQLPVGNGRKFLNRSGVVNDILGEWEFTGIFSVQSGFPFTVLSATDFSNTGSTSPRPDRTCNGVGHKAVSSWFNANCFNTDALSAALSRGQPRFGDSGHDILDGPGVGDLDISLTKDFRLGERAKVQFQAEAFNLFNQVRFGPPVATVGNPNIGQISSAADGRDIQFGVRVAF